MGSEGGILKAKVIFILTVSIQNKPEHILNLYAKEVFDNPPKNIYFYEGYGKKGEAKLVFTNGQIRIRQWFAIGSISEIDSIIQSLIENQSFSFMFKKEIFFTSPKTLLKDRNSIEFLRSETFVDHFPKPEREMAYYVYDECEILESIHWALFKNTFVENLSIDSKDKGYSEKIFPYGFISLRELHNYLVSNIAFINEKKLIDVIYHGEQGKIRNELIPPENYIGFVRESPIERKHIGVRVSQRKINSQEFSSLSWSPVNEFTGIFQMNLSEPLNEGYIYFINTFDDTILAAEHFSLIKKFTVSMDMQNFSFIDIFGKKVSVSSRRKEMISGPINECSFYRESFPAFNEAAYSEFLSEELSRVIKQLGKDLFIFDPYFLGNLNIEDDKLKLTKDNSIFINAILLILAEYKFESLNFLCRRKKTGISFGEILSQCKILKREIQKVGNFQLTVRFSNDAFHDRYWLNLNDDTSIPLHISTSISGLLSNGELRVQPIKNQQEIEKVRARNKKLWRNAEANEISL